MSKSNLKYKTRRQGGEQRLYGNLSNNHRLQYCSYGIQAITAGPITEKQLETIKTKLSKNKNKNSFRMIYRIQANYPVSKKAVGQRMGGGKSSVDHKAKHTRIGQIIVEFDTYPSNVDNIIKVFHECLSIKIQLRSNLL